MIPAQPGQFGRCVGLELDCFIAAQLDDHGVQHTTLPTIDRLDHTGSRRGVNDFGVLLVGEEHITQLDLVAFSHLHGRLQTDIIGTEQRNRPDGAGIAVYDLLRISRNRQIQTFFCVD